MWLQNKINLLRWLFLLCCFLFSFFFCCCGFFSKLQKKLNLNNSTPFCWSCCFLLSTLAIFVIEFWSRTFHYPCFSLALLLFFCTLVSSYKWSFFLNFIYIINYRVFFFSLFHVVPLTCFCCKYLFIHLQGNDGIQWKCGREYERKCNKISYSKSYKIIFDQNFETSTYRSGKQTYVCLLFERY